MLRIIVSLLFLVGFKANAGIEEQRKLIDRYLEFGNTKQLEDINAYLQSSLKNNKEYAIVRELFETKDINTLPEELANALLQEIFRGDTKTHRQFFIFLGGTALMEEILKKRSPINKHLISFGDFASVLLDPYLCEGENKYREYIGFPINSDDEDPYANSLKIANILLEYGWKTYLNITFSSKPYHSEESLEKESSLFKPVTFTGEEAIFGYESFVYALSKNCWLDGLSGDLSLSLHGGTYITPATNRFHDDGHYGTAVGNYDTKPLTPQKIQPLAEKLYAFIQSADTQKERDFRSWLSFYLFNENMDILYMEEKEISVKDYYVFLNNKLIENLKYLLDRAAHYSKEKPKENDRTIAAYFVRFCSNHPKTLVEAFPGLEKEIYGENESNRALFYDAEKTLYYFIDKLDVFSESFLKYLSNTDDKE